MALPTMCSPFGVLLLALIGLCSGSERQDLACMRMIGGDYLSVPSNGGKTDITINTHLIKYKGTQCTFVIQSGNTIYWKFTSYYRYQTILTRVGCEPYLEIKDSYGSSALGCSYGEAREPNLYQEYTHHTDKVTLTIHMPHRLDSSYIRAKIVFFTEDTYSASRIIIIIICSVLGVIGFIFIMTVIIVCCCCNKKRTPGRVINAPGTLTEMQPVAPVPINYQGGQPVVSYPTNPVVASAPYPTLPYTQSPYPVAHQPPPHEPYPLTHQPLPEPYPTNNHPPPSYNQLMEK